jgi:hypothetical protein
MFEESMAEISEEFEITSDPGCLHFHTQSDGDTLTIAGISLNQEDAVTLAYLINGSETLHIEIKVNE